MAITPIQLVELLRGVPGLIHATVRQCNAHLDNHYAGAVNHCGMPKVGNTDIEMAIVVHWARLENDHVYPINKASVGGEVMEWRDQSGRIQRSGRISAPFYHALVKI